MVAHCIWCRRSRREIGHGGLGVASRGWFQQDRAGAAGGEVVPPPVDEDLKAVTETDQVHDVDAQPEQPRQPPPDAQLVPAGSTRDQGQLGAGIAAAQHRHHPLVTVTEVRQRLAADQPGNLPARVPPGLDGHRGEHRQRLSGRRLSDRSQVAGGEHIGMIGGLQPGVDHDPAVIADVEPEAAAQAVRRDPGRPDHRAGLDLLAATEGHVPGISGLDGLAEADVDTAAPQVGERSPGGARAETVEEPPGGLHEGDLKPGGRLAQFAGHRGQRADCLNAGRAAPATTTLIGPASWRAAACSRVLSRCLRNLIASGSVYSGHA